ncbi:uncharacterized protein LOC110228286 [Arabidopsis lyrata subsp. lyrata]|uniref:uncharacterized protein LOC110228286 n=1 Tax=Arabidopsis lyrata subsp. lyrata TaxID=81972 RepID=UPI000A29AF5A|nr:uncharacterized protein LOC110228286 [Arabidopsis lyrata subsp. lyrata]|eukprot:XP_020880757.1 uncharacterized protein LOC110228286 [Arabidopsis lyrata subsp. lyrata]
MSNLPSEFRKYEADDLEALMGEGTEPHTQTGGEFDLHPQSQSTVDFLNDLRRLCHIPPKVEMVVPEPYESPESVPKFGQFPLLTSSIFTRPSSRGQLLGILLLWREFTVPDILVKMGLTHPVDPPPAEIDLSSLNARDRRRIREADKKVKDQISQIGKNKKNASSVGDEKVYQKTLLLDDWSFEGSKSMAVTINNAPSFSPAADIMVAATAEEGGPLDGPSFTKKRKAEGPEPPIQGRSKSKRKAEAISSSPPIPESADIQGRNHDSGIVFREPLSSGMLPPRHPRGNTSRARSSPSSGLVARASSPSNKEKIGNIFRCFHTRSRKKLPSFGHWRDDIKKMYISHSFHSSQATLDVNSIINHYEEELTKVSKRAAITEGEIEKLQSSNQLAKETTGLDSARQKEIEQLERSGEETRKILTETEQNLKTLSKVKTAAEELERKNESLSELKDQDVRKISHDARKEVKGVGQKFLLAVQEFISADKAWNKLNSERDELKSNLDLIKEIEEGSINLAEEKETVGAELAETEAKLATAPQPYLDLQQFVYEFADSPPLTEPNAGLSLDEMMLTGSPSAHFNEFGTNVDKISSERTQEFSGQDPASLPIPEVVLTAQDAAVGGAPDLSQVGGGGGSPMNK